MRWVKADESEQSVGACGQAGAGLALACEGGASDTGRWMRKCAWRSGGAGVWERVTRSAVGTSDTGRWVNVCVEIEVCGWLSGG